MLADARTVTILVHGVGDHIALDIGENATSGRVPPSRIAKINLKDLPFPRASSFTWRGRSADSGEALRIQNPEGIDIMLPIAWAHFRIRAESWPSQADPITVIAMLPLIGFALFVLSWDLLRCVPKAGGLWKIPVAALAMVLPTLLMWLYVDVRMALDGLLSWQSTMPAIVVGLLTVAIAIGIKLFTPGIDFIADVARYVGSAKFRDKRESDLANVFRYVRAQAPSAYIVVVSHSLGTVLSSHALARKQVLEAVGQCNLITMGCPLVLMAKIFPNSVLSPDQLLERYANHPGVSWTNLWRDSDFIGKALVPSFRSGSFSERSIGRGGHSNYWGDIRVWQTIESHSSAAPANISVAAPTVPLERVTPSAERQKPDKQDTSATQPQRGMDSHFVELRLKLQLLRFFWLPVAAVAYAWDARTFFVLPGGPTVLASMLSLARVLWSVGVFSLLVTFWLASKSLKRGDTNPADLRAMEADHRNARAWLVGAFAILVVTGLWHF
jgi:hypothetical protein